MRVIFCFFHSPHGVGIIQTAYNGYILASLWSVSSCEIDHSAFYFFFLSFHFKTLLISKLGISSHGRGRIHRDKKRQVSHLTDMEGQRKCGENKNLEQKVD